MNTTRDAVHTSAVRWHALDTNGVLTRLGSELSGLSPKEAAHRISQYGPNVLPAATKRSALHRFGAQFHNLLIYVLLGASTVTLILQHWVDSVVILGVVIVNAVIGFVQEGRAEDALTAIRDMLSPQAMIVRGGERATVDVANIVPGDIVPLQAGDRVPADLRLLTARGLRIDEAALTGESVPVEKTPQAVAQDTPLADRRSMAYSGTLITAGQGIGIVVATGTETQLGQISALVATVDKLTTPLLRQMTAFSRRLTLAIFAISTVTFLFGTLVRGYTASEMFLATVGLAVAAIPEGLPAIMTITLAIGVQRMADRNAIIRRLPAVETLGTVSVICSDKTGTLTRNQMTVRVLALPDDKFVITGTGYDPHGGFNRNGHECDVGDNSSVITALRAMALCNDASVTLQDDAWVAQGDPMEAALVVAAIKGGIDQAAEMQRFPRTDVIPFDSAHKFMATLHHGHDASVFMFVKGAPEQILQRCDAEHDATGDVPLKEARWERRVEALGCQGYRVIALAAKPMPTHTRELTFNDVDTGLVLIGLCGLIDPPRPTAIDAIKTCQGSGICVKMITGDHQVTASAIAAQVGLRSPERVLTGSELQNMDDADLRNQVRDVDVYARVTPEHKLRLVALLQSHGQVVAMTGDGVNDAPALRRADVGVAMGQSGTEVAKDSAEMVLTDDNFATIVNAVEEGRTVYDNLRKAILFILPTNGGEALIMLGAILLGYQQLPLTPVQILWVNMVTAATLALALAFEPTESGLMQRPPRDPREPLLTRLFLWRILFVSLILVAGTFTLFLVDRAAGSSIEHSRTIAVNTLVVFEIFYLFNARYTVQPVLTRQGLLGNHFVLIAVAVLIGFQLAFTYLPAMQTLFGTAGLSASSWITVIAVSSSVLWLVELEKVFMRHKLG